MPDKWSDLIWLFVLFVVLIVVLPMLLWLGMWSGSYMHGMGGMMSYGWGFTSLIPLAFLVLLVLGLYYLIKEFTKTGKSEQPGHGDSALDILKERYARGEITSEEYLKMKEELEES